MLSNQNWQKLIKMYHGMNSHTVHVKKLRAWLSALYTVAAQFSCLLQADVTIEPYS